MNTMIEMQNKIKELFVQWSKLKEVERQTIQKIRYSGPDIDEKEYLNILDAIFDDWWSRGKYTNKAQKKLSEVSNRDFGLLLNSGSSANLVLMKAAREQFFKKGDKILTLSCGFPTTVIPIIDSELVPIFVDIDLDTLGLDPELLDTVLKRDKNIKGIFIAHTLGFPNKIEQLLEVIKKYPGVQLFFDCCDAYGTKYKGNPIQAYGKAATFSFYVAHHITSGEGGGVVTNDNELHTKMRGFRDWGRYCSSSNCCIRSENKELFCPQSKLTETCDLPDDYSVNYQFEWLGYNLKMLELQSAMLLAQLEKLDTFSNIRRRNYSILYDYVSKSKFEYKLWPITEEISPFSFPILLSENVPFKRKHIIRHLTQNGIESRLLFGGNLIKHPAFSKKSSLFDVYGDQTNSNKILNRFFMLGVSNILTVEQMYKIINVLSEFEKQW